MSVGFGLWLAFVGQNLISQSTAQKDDYPYWHGGDWAMESLNCTDEPIGNTEEWAHYLHTLGDEYEEYPERRQQKKEFVGADEFDLLHDPPDWYPLAPNEDPYVAVIYRRDKGPSKEYRTLFPDDPNPEGSHISPGTACGGALLSTRHVLTACGCLVTLITSVLGVRSPLPRPGFATYDIYDPVDRDIYVTHVTKFDPDFKHQIDIDRNKWPKSLFLNCRDTLVELGTRYKDNYDVGKKVARLDGQPVVVPFTPDIRPDFFRFFPKWPPVPVNRITDKAVKERVDLISLGMRLSKPGRFQFFSSVSASLTELRHCRAESIVCNSTRVYPGVSHTCFCPLRPGIQKLVGGVIGWPLVQKGNLVGITGSLRHPADGTVMGTILHPTIVTRIEEYVGKKVLEDQNTPAPQFRARSLKKKYLIYDYDTFNRKTKNRPDSKATCIGPTALILSLVLISWNSIG